VEEQYVEPTTGGRIRALVPVGVYLLGAALMYWRQVSLLSDIKSSWPSTQIIATWSRLSVGIYWRLRGFAS